MVWSGEEELKSTLLKVQEHCVTLKQTHDLSEVIPADASDEDVIPSLPAVAVGVERDLATNKCREISLEPYRPSSETLILNVDASTERANRSDFATFSLELVDSHRPEGVVS